MKKQENNNVNEEIIVNEPADNFVMPEVSADDFKLVQVDKSIHDTKFQTKATTFAKDAFKRFVRNKSSVVAASILAVLIGLATFVPIFNTNPLDEVTTHAQRLPPRWRGFDGSGFMDGTMVVNDIALDSITDPAKPMPAGYNPDAVVKILKQYDDFISAPSPFAVGGNIAIRTDKRTMDGGINSPRVSLDFTKTYTLNIDINEERQALEDVKPVYTLYANVSYDALNLDATTRVVLQAPSTQYENVLVNDVSAKILAARPVTETATIFPVKFGIDVATVAEGAYPSLYVKKVKLTNTDNPNDTGAARVSFDDANAVLLRDATTSPDKWLIVGSASKTLFEGVIQRVNFRYDPYINSFGVKHNFEIGETIINEYINKGWIKYDFNVGVSSLEILSDKSPIIAVNSQKVQTILGRTVKVVFAEVSMYRYYGHSEIPYYFFGTNQKGQDHFKSIFAGLRTSLLLGLAAMLINVTIGLFWGSISGYFGGWTDLIMERLTDILGGVPWIVIMTLCILHLGNSFGVFLLAITLTGWIGVSSGTRSQFYRYKGREYVLAARTLGASDARLIFKHILPNSVGPIVTSAVLMIPGIIFSEATISYLGLGLQGLPSLGVALSEAQEFLKVSPFLTLTGALVISVLMICFNLFGNGLRDALNPSLKGVD